MIDTHGTGKHSEDVLEKVVREVFPLRPARIIETLGLKRPIYQETAAYGHFGRDGFPWEEVDRIQDIQTALKG
jgi:S-adenosylmethionine synthetase